MRGGTRGADDHKLLGHKQDLVPSGREHLARILEPPELQNVLDSWLPTHHPDRFINQLYNRYTIVSLWFEFVSLFLSLCQGLQVLHGLRGLVVGHLSTRVSVETSGALSAWGSYVCWLSDASLPFSEPGAYSLQGWKCSASWH